MLNILDRLKTMRNRESTKANYVAIWRMFNNFIIKLDIIPKYWEDRVFLFVTHLALKCRKSTTIRCYILAIKAILWENNYDLSNSELELRAITRVCRLANDKLQPRLPVKLQLLEMIIFEIKRIYKQQPYLESMYSALFTIAYYGLLRIGEVAAGDHTIEARNVFIATNKNKIELILFSSKTHAPNARPQKINISALEDYQTENTTFKHFCPFTLMTNYLNMRADFYYTVHEPFFVFQGGIPVPQENVRKLLSQAIENIGLDKRLYQFHGIHVGRTTDLYNWGYTVDEIKDIGRWKSNAKYKYIKN